MFRLLFFLKENIQDICFGHSLEMSHSEGSNENHNKGFINSFMKDLFKKKIILKKKVRQQKHGKDPVLKGRKKVAFFIYISKHGYVNLACQTSSVTLG